MSRQEMKANADIPVSDGERRHDPLCQDGRAEHNKPPVSQCGWCEFATRVREDERGKPSEWITPRLHTERMRENYELGYAAGLWDAAASVINYGEERKSNLTLGAPSDDITAALRVAATRIADLGDKIGVKVNE